MKTEDPAFQRGKEIRREIFGEAGIAALDNVDDFQGPAQDVVTRWCFGETWGRPGLDFKTRSLLTIAILAGQSRPNQFKHHVRGAVANGATKEEIRETLLHTMVYVGVAHGSDSWALATEALKEIGAY